MVKKISQSEFEETKSGVAVVDFSATWCGPCKMVAPVLEQLSEEFDGKIKFYNVDVDENQELAEQYGITSIPAILIMQDGEKKDMQIGFQPKEALAKVFAEYV